MNIFNRGKTVRAHLFLSNENQRQDSIDILFLVTNSELNRNGFKIMRKIYSTESISNYDWLYHPSINVINYRDFQDLGRNADVLKCPMRVLKIYVSRLGSRLVCVSTSQCDVTMQN